MKVNFTHGEQFLIAVDGRLDTVTSAQLEEELQGQEIQESTVVVDFEKVEYVSSAGLRLLLALKKQLDGQGKTMDIININKVVREIFTVTGFINALNVK